MDFRTEIKILIEKDELDLIPVRDVDKSPFRAWKEAKRISDSIELFDEINRHSTSSIAIRLGKYSKGLICIDVDTKHKLGFDAIIINDFKSLYPDLWDKFRVEKTPSGGYHFLYRISEEIENFPTKIESASRLPSEEEKTNRPDLKKYCFLEILAQGQLTQCFPSPKYTRIKDGITEGSVLDGDVVYGIGNLTYQEHCCVVAHCNSYDELKVEVEREKVKRDVIDLYIEGGNPFDEYNLSDLGSKILEEYGWTYWKTSGKRNVFRKPGKENRNEVDATFSLEKRYFKIHTTTTELESKSYTPSSILCKLRYKGDWKQTREYLVALGFGKMKPNQERNIIKKCIRLGNPLPANISEEGKLVYEEEKSKLGEKYPHGIFWVESGSDVFPFRINRERLYNVAYGLGFRNHKDEAVLISGFVVKKVESSVFYNALKNYISEDEENIEELLSIYEAFIQNSGKFTISRLEILDTSLILRSEKQVSYKFFKNCYVRITKEEEDILDYEKDLDKLIWQHDIKEREYYFKEREEVENGLYFKYIKNAIGWDSYLMKCIGFYVHEHRDEEGYLCIATEQCENPSDGGGSGKNIFWNLLGLSTTFKSTAASMINLNTNLLQSWNGEKIFCISDMPKNFDIIFFKDIITGNATVNKKYINEFSVDISDMCKIGASSNYSFDDADPGVKRRVRPIEFTDYYTLHGGVKAVHGKMFPKDWTEMEYLYFDNIMMWCIQEYLKGDNLIEKKELSVGGWKKQFSEKFNHLSEFIIDNIENWKGIGRVKNADFMKEYETYCRDNNIKKQYTPFTINKALEKYCLHNQIGFKFKNFTFREGLATFAGRCFYVLGEEELIENQRKLEEQTVELPF